MAKKVKILKTENPNLCFVGDIHGNFNAITGLMKRYNTNDIVYIFCGDCGFGFEKLEYYNQLFNKIGKTASKYNAECYFIRGNHESKEYYDSNLINKKRFKTVTDYTVIQTPIHNILCVGGATSIDRMYRITANEKYVQDYLKYHHCTVEEAVNNAKKCYWEDEQVIYNQELLDELKTLGIEIDIVATHTCPSFAKPITKEGINYWLTMDSNLLHDLNEERTSMDNIYNKLLTDNHPLKKWIYGHFHSHNSEWFGDVNFVMLDMDRYGKLDVLEVR